MCVIQFRVFKPRICGVWQFNPRGAACPGFPGRSRCCCCCCLLATLYQFPHGEAPRRPSTNSEHGGIKAGWEAAGWGRVAGVDRTCVGTLMKMFSGPGCCRCGRYREVWWQKSSESLASLLCSCVGCLGECAATAFCCFGFFFPFSFLFLSSLEAFLSFRLFTLTCSFYGVHITMDTQGFGIGVSS